MSNTQKIAKIIFVLNLISRVLLLAFMSEYSIYIGWFWELEYSRRNAIYNVISISSTIVFVFSFFALIVFLAKQTLHLSVINVYLRFSLVNNIALLGMLIGMLTISKVQDERFGIWLSWTCMNTLVCLFVIGKVRSYVDIQIGRRESMVRWAESMVRPADDRDLV